jgi:hypothetical protein
MSRGGRGFGGRSEGTSEYIVHIIRYIIHIEMLGCTSFGMSLIPIGWTTILLPTQTSNIYI